MLLAIDTATRTVSLALHDGEAVVAETSWRTANHHTVELPAALQELLARAHLTPAALTALAVARGPGSYTGLRIGMSLAKGIALAHQPPLPLVGVPTLDILAAALPPTDQTLVTVAQAGRGRINAGFYHQSGSEWQPEGDPFIATWQELIERLEPPALVTGEIDPAGREQLAAHRERGIIAASAALGLRRASLLAELAYRQLEAGAQADPETLAPLYLS